MGIKYLPAIVAVRINYYDKWRNLQGSTFNQVAFLNVPDSM